MDYCAIFGMAEWTYCMKMPFTSARVRFFYTRLRHTKLIVLKYHYSEFTEAKDDGDGGDNWSCKTCKAPVNPTLTNQQQAFYWLEAFPVAHPTVSKQ